MKPNRPLSGNPAPIVKRRSPNAELRSATVKSRRRDQLASQWKTLAVGVFVICGVFVALELTKPLPQKSAPTTMAQQARPAQQATAPTVSEAAEVSSAAPVALAETAIANPPVAGVSKPPAKVAPVAGEAERLGKEKELVLTGLDAGREAAITRDKDLFVRAVKGQAWNA